MDSPYQPTTISSYNIRSYNGLKRHSQPDQYAIDQYECIPALV